MAVAGAEARAEAGAGAEIMAKIGAGAGAENKKFWLRNAEKIYVFLCVKFLKRTKVYRKLFLKQETGSAPPPPSPEKAIEHV